MKKRSITIAGHRTSVALEPEFWALIEKMASEQNLSLADFIAQIDETRAQNNLASALRLTVLDWLQEQLGQDE
ncbi:ribbon-helix-helix domain-containing protein [Maritalea mediterranea]|uniref:Ribbon-helix-helix domain-containing protein n=1 Tax=Maritalea mediterranea TaxID=2909667 RepID=A0ABS9E7P4_9HYPH|nr:ribbon-helix-helix domain-containing protein [Maritalea mediterranea]MCF4098903.1 ribbon-helix-helix domain-containing protein [Maritalea mediterranea]